MKKAIDGLVLRELKAGENDRRILVLTAEGKMWISAKGARSIKSKTASVCGVYTYANFEIYEKSGARWLSGGSINNSFQKLNATLEGYALAAYIVQLADEITGENDPSDDVLRTTLNTLYAIENRLKPFGQIKAAYELFAASVSGFMPDLTACADCGCESFEGDLWLDVMNGSIVCADCLKKRSGDLPLPDTDAYEARNILVPIDSSALEAMRYVLYADSRRLFAFSLSDERSFAFFCRASETYLLNHLERNFDTLHFYNSIKE